jgi:ATP-dependent DNA helicase RecG
MRPSLLNPLFAGVTSLKGVGDKQAGLIAKAVGRPQLPVRILDLVLRLPFGMIDRRHRCTIAELPQQGVATLEVTVGKHRPPPANRPGIPYRVVVHDGTGSMHLVFFKVYGNQIKDALPEGERRFISGAIDWYNGQPQMAHPDHMVAVESAGLIPALEPVYRLTAGLAAKTYAKAVSQSLARLPDLPEWQDGSWLQHNGFPSFSVALAACHTVASPAVLEPENPARRRLAFDELLANQLALALVRAHLKRSSGRRFHGDGHLQRAIVAALPYKLTAAQEQALGEIRADMAKPLRMIRLLQGDVGAGKTAVAFLALANAVEAGSQGALMVPTEILARQHFASLSSVAGQAGIHLGLLTGREKGKVREDTLKALAGGSIHILVGTHALFQEGVAFKDLGLAVIDEQHRFGVHQRLALQQKGEQNPDLLVMTATPIPRTLALTAYGDMDASRITEKPPGRKPVDTRVMPLSRMDEVATGLGRIMAHGGRAYWVCPLVEESEVMDLAAAEDRVKHLAAAFPGKVGLIHGRMKGPERDQVMAAFKAGHIGILVSTTVIEVGVDVPEAVIMVIENAERFGLAQLHQLRGRVGRGSNQSHCLLLYQEPLGETARARLEIMRATEDGFIIAEEDLRLRGAGEVLGTQQSGLPDFRLADLSVHADLLVAARDDAQLILERDPKLRMPRGEALRHLLYLFEREEAIMLLGAG